MLTSGTYFIRPTRSTHREASANKNIWVFLNERKATPRRLNRPQTNPISQWHFSQERNYLSAGVTRLPLTKLCQYSRIDQARRGGDTEDKQREVGNLFPDACNRKRDAKLLITAIIEPAVVQVLFRRIFNEPGKGRAVIYSAFVY